MPDKVEDIEGRTETEQDFNLARKSPKQYSAIQVRNVKFNEPKRSISPISLAQ